MRALFVLALFLVAPAALTADGSWSAVHNFQWWHVPLPGYESRIHPERRA